MKPKAETISQIVHLKQIMKRWKTLSLGGRRQCSGEVRPGHVVVYVGDERKRFVIPLRFINFPVFISLLNKTEEEIGINPTGGVVVSCEVEVFNSIVGLLQKDEQRHKGLTLHAFMALVGGGNGGCSFASGGGGCSSSFSPLLPKTRV